MSASKLRRLAITSAKLKKRGASSGPRVPYMTCPQDSARVGSWRMGHAANSSLAIQFIRREKTRATTKHGRGNLPKTHGPKKISLPVLKCQEQPMPEET